MKIYPKHLRLCGFCIQGTKTFLQKHNIDWEKAKREGVDEEVIMATKDAMAISLLKKIKEMLNATPNKERNSK